MDEVTSITRRQFIKEGALAMGSAAVLVESVIAPDTAKEKSAKKPRYGFLIDLNRCKGCFACAVACKEEFDVPLGVFRNQVIIHEKGKFPSVKRLFLPWLCNHCERPICISRCPVEPKKALYIAPNGEKIEYEKRATYKRPDGLVLVDNGLMDAYDDRCIGCGACVALCPYQVRSLVETENGYRANKCSLCVHRVDSGDKPACVKACPHSARFFGNLNDPSSDISKALASARREGKSILTLPSLRYRDESINTEPKCFYIGMTEEELKGVYQNGRCIKDEAQQKLE